MQQVWFIVDIYFLQCNYVYKSTAKIMIVSIP